MSSKDAAKNWVEHFFHKTELSKVQPYLEANSDKDLYWCPHGFSKPRRIKGNAVLPKLLWADLDEADPRNIRFKPTIAIESSPGRYVGIWVTDETINESLNRRLTYAIGADPGGWDLTQVLRIPTTINYKYSATPKVRLLWTDGPSVTLSQLANELPLELDEPSEADGDAGAIFKKYSRKLEPWLRKELISGKPTEGKRSEMIWRIENSLLEAGVSPEECFLLVKASPWNKFRGRRNEDQQLRRELQKAVDQHFSKSSAKPTEDTQPQVFLGRSLADVEEVNIEWLWYPYLARGELTILEGDPGLGKSYVAHMIAKAIVDRNRLPCVKDMTPVKGKVAYFDMENDAGHVTKKRLVGNGCINLKDFFQEEEFFSVDDDERWERVVQALDQLRPTLIVFDTINTYIGKADTHKSSEVQQALARFKELARRFHCAVLVLRHLTKGSKDKALYRGQGSIAFTGLARVVMTVGSVPDDPETRVIAVTKLNIARKPKALTYTIEGLPDTKEDQDRSRFVWGEFVELTSDDILAAPTKSEGGGSNERRDAVDFLRSILEEGPEEVAKITRMAEKRSISARTLQRAAEELGVIKKVVGFGKARRSIWELADA